MTQKNISKIIIALVGVVVIAGLYLAGSPVQARNKKLDYTRAERMQAAMNDIQNYYFETGKVPANLDEIQNISWPQNRTNPDTNELFVYTSVDKQSAKLCATYLTDTTKEKNNHGMIWGPPMPYSEKGRTVISFKSPFNHEAGEVCFDSNLEASKMQFDLPSPPGQLILN